MESTPTPLTPNVYNVVPQFLGTDGATSATPFLIPPMQNVQNYWTSPITIAVANVVGSKQSTGGNACNITGNSDFALSWQGTGPSALAVVTVQPTNIWQVGAAARQQLYTNFLSFWAALEQLELSQCLATNASQVIKQRVAEALPLSISETLQYVHGFNQASGYIDLQPGMRIRVEYSVYQYVSPNFQQMNGFVGAGAGYYDVCGAVGSDGVQRIAFDAFLGANRSPSLQTTGSNPGVGASGVIDLQLGKTARRYYRLFYPVNIIPSWYTGSMSTALNVTLIGADNLTDLTLATTTYTGSGGKCAADPRNNTIICTFFNGRDIVVPEITVNLDNQPVFVPVGTTVRNLVDRQANYTYNPYVAQSDQKIAYSRKFTPSKSSTLRMIVLFNNLSSSAYTSRPDVYDLPVVKGDWLNFNSNFK